MSHRYEMFSMGNKVYLVYKYLCADDGNGFSSSDQFEMGNTTTMLHTRTK